MLDSNPVARIGISECLHADGRRLPPAAPPSPGRPPPRQTPIRLGYINPARRGRPPRLATIRPRFRTTGRRKNPPANAAPPYSPSLEPRGAPL